MIFGGDSIALFRNESPTARTYVARDIVRVDDYFSLDLHPTEHVYVLGRDRCCGEGRKSIRARLHRRYGFGREGEPRVVSGQAGRRRLPGVRPA